MKALGRIILNLVTINSIVWVYATIIGVDTNAIQAYSQHCRVDIKGFVPGTCAPVEIATTTESAWIAIGQQLALQWNASPSSPYFVTTCIKEKPTNSHHVALLFIAGYDGFPLCQPPNGPQEIAGIAMLETTIRDEFPNGVYMLTNYADKTMPESDVHVNSDGSMDLLIANINQTLIATNGSMATDTIGVNSVQYSTPIGSRYMISTTSYPVVLDITQYIGSSGLKWWNIGRESRKAVAMTWNYGHNVDHGIELVTIQLWPVQENNVKQKQSSLSHYCTQPRHVQCHR
ncbi:hypothetical protein AC1031_012466 [Aphanomyces cochlioides]|nr:hypothetical protein AC1031_012466 [Aphanomyces cochlioides]